MRIAIGTDESTHVTGFVVERLKELGHDVETMTPEPPASLPWAEVGAWVGNKVASGSAGNGVLFCWTGTGVSIAANKVPGVRAALCGDAETARGARLWNDANVLVMSLRTTSEAVAKEILDAWLATEPSSSEEDVRNVAYLGEIESANVSPR